MVKDRKSSYKVDILLMENLVTSVMVEFLLEGKTYPYENLLEQVNSYKLLKTPFDTKIHNIDDFMVDAYVVYDKYHKIQKQNIDSVIDLISSNDSFKDLLKLFKMDGLDVDAVKDQLKLYIDTFEKLMINCDFEGVQIRGIQKNFLNDKMSDAISDEDYELCAFLRDKINSI